MSQQPIRDLNSIYRTCIVHTYVDDDDDDERLFLYVFTPKADDECYTCALNCAMTWPQNPSTCAYIYIYIYVERGRVLLNVSGAPGVGKRRLVLQKCNSEHRISLYLQGVIYIYRLPDEIVLFTIRENILIHLL